MAVNWQEEFTKANQAYRQAAAQAAQPLDMNSYYNQAYEGLAGSYGQALDYYGQARQTQLDALAAARDAGLKQYDQQLSAAQGQNYAARMAADRANPQMLASMGLTGGAAEKLKAKQAADYAASRSATQAAYNRNVAGLMSDQQAQQAAIEAQYAQQRMQAQQQWQADAREESRYLWGQAEDARRYAADSAFRDYEAAVGNTQWQAGYDLDLQKYLTGVDQWHQQYFEGNRQWQAAYDQKQSQYNQDYAFEREKYENSKK